MEKEIEIKVQVEDFQMVANALEDLGCVFSESVIQDDTVFINYDRPFMEFTPSDPFLRIRKSKGEVLFTYKQGEEMDSVERECKVSDAKQLEDILVFLGFRPEVRVVKTRRKTKYKEMEICLDQVEGLGSFIEIERITVEDSEVVQKEMLEFLASLGIDVKKRVMNGYDTITWLKNNPEYKKKTS